jgi:hypothetical protein
LSSNPKDKRFAKNESIFIADNLGGNWLNIKAFPFFTDGYSFKNPTFNSDATTIYFSSNQTGGVGGFDIWQSSLEKDKWTKPKNLGKIVNSKFDEINPFLMQDKLDNTLYFSSNRDGGFGGFDIYRSKAIENSWQEVQMQPAPINSAGDDISIIYDDEIKTGYVASDRKGGKGGFDVYRFIPFNLKLNVESVEEEVLSPISYALVQLFDGNIKLEEAISNDAGEASFFVGKDKNYTVVISKDGYKQTTIQTATFNKLSGDSVEAIAQLIKDKTFNPKTSTSVVSPQNYIIFVGRLIDASTNKPAKAKMRMVNYTTSKMRDLDIDDKGMFQIKLMLNNNYKIIIENGSNKITDEITTFGLSVDQTKIKDYLLTGNKFKMLENKIYDANSLPVKIKETYKINDDRKATVSVISGDSINTAKIFATDSTKRPEQYYKMQLGNFDAGNLEFNEFKQFGTLEKTTSDNGKYVYRIGDFYNLDDARLSLEYARVKGYNLAFLLQYNKEKLSKIIK